MGRTSIIYGSALVAAMAQARAQQEALDLQRRIHTRQQLTQAVTGMYYAAAGQPARRRTHCIGCGAPQEPVCSYCLTPEAPCHS